MADVAVDNVNVLRVGFFAPDFSLPDTQGNIYSLKENLAGEFTCLCFFPYGDNDRVINHLKDLNLGLPMTASGLPVRVLAVCPEKIAHLRELKEKLKLEYPILSDIRMTAARRYYVIDNFSFKPSVYFSLFVIDDGDVIRHRVVEVPGLSRYSPDEVRTEISKLI